MKKRKKRSKKQKKKKTNKYSKPSQEDGKIWHPTDNQPKRNLKKAQKKRFEKQKN